MYQQEFKNAENYIYSMNETLEQLRELAIRVIKLEKWKESLVNKIAKSGEDNLERHSNEVKKYYEEGEQLRNDLKSMKRTTSLIGSLETLWDSIYVDADEYDLIYDLETELYGSSSSYETPVAEWIYQFQW